MIIVLIIIVEALHRYIARTPAALVGVALVDGVGERRAQNQPGTDQEYPNWKQVDKQDIAELAAKVGTKVVATDIDSEAGFPHINGRGAARAEKASRNRRNAPKAMALLAHRRARRKGTAARGRHPPPLSIS